MNGFFSLDGPFYKYGSILADIMVLSLVWLVCSLPLFTIGASTSALYYVTTRRIANREGYILRDFWTAFKSSFKKATLLWLLLLLVVLILIINIINIEVTGSMATFLLPCQICFLIEIALITVYLFPITARFEMGFRQTIKSAFYMANKHIFTSLTCVVLALGILLGIYLYPVLFLVAMGLYAWLTSYLIIRVFKRYRPEMDKDPALELAELEQARSAARYGLQETAEAAAEQGAEESWNNPTPWANPEPWRIPSEMPWMNPATDEINAPETDADAPTEEEGGVDGQGV